jgi:hypothetical protein
MRWAAIHLGDQAWWPFLLNWLAEADGCLIP